jgi:hypothetical protein
MSSRKDRQIHAAARAIMERLGVPEDQRKQVFALVKREARKNPHGGVRIAAGAVEKAIHDAAWDRMWSMLVDRLKADRLAQ